MQFCYDDCVVQLGNTTQLDSWLAVVSNTLSRAPPQAVTYQLNELRILVESVQSTGSSDAETLAAMATSLSDVVQQLHHIANEVRGSTLLLNGFCAKLTGRTTTSCLSTVHVS